jgi:hypothetical protein
MGILATLLNIPIENIGKYIVANIDLDIDAKVNLIEKQHGGIENVLFVYEKVKLEFYWQLIMKKRYLE